MKRLIRSSPVSTFLFFSSVLAIAGSGCYLMADYLWGLGWDFGSGVLWFLFAILFSYLAFGFSHAAFGFLIRRIRSGRPLAEETVNFEETEEEERAVLHRVAVVIPIYNEPVRRVFSGVRAIFESLKRQEDNDIFDFFILSDSTDPEQWLAEEAAWMKLTEELQARDRIFYRHRLNNVGKKSGNISDFCRTWGDHYRYMIVLDADSIMLGTTLVNLYEQMESNPRVALIQSAPVLVGGESIFGRMQQFANRLYGPIFLQGLAYWSKAGGNFWGHNAIIRLRPFISECDLPKLPGRRPFGGQILSHDFVEAGLLLRAGWEVWLDHELQGSYEEGPQGVIESAQRDQRWCQGNLQHGLLLFARGLRGKTRVHLANGILGYLASPLWLLFMCVAFGKAFLDTPEGEGNPLIGGIPILIFTFILLFGPKLLALIELLFDSRRRKEFGGFLNAVTGAIVETFFSALLAPVLMMFHTKFVVWNLIGRTVDWGSQRRGAHGTSWDEAISAHGVQTLFGLAVGIVTLFAQPLLFWWLFPVLLGLWLSIPFSVWTSRRAVGLSLKREKLFLTPEEESPPAEIVEALDGHEGQGPKPFFSVTNSVLDPFLNAVHVSLLRRARRRLVTGQRVYDPEEAFRLPTEGQSAERRSLAEQLLREGPRALSREDLVTILSDIDSMLWIHREAWMRPSDELSSWWERAIRKSSVAV
ncbi:MAG: glucans biosynthesis glucosyltransferase MdoH [Verrucomicrobiota bacterium]